MTTALVIIVITAVIMVKIITAVIRFCDRNVGFLLVLRWLARHHGGRTNATFFHRGTKITHPSDRASKWHHRAGWERSVIRIGSIAVAGSALYGWFTARLDTETAFIAAGLILLAYGQYRAYRAIKLANYRSGVLNPLTKAVADQLGMSEKAAIDSVSLRPDFASVKDADARLGTIVLPDNWQSNPGLEEALSTLLQARLGTNIDLRFRTAKAPFTVEITRTPQPPNIARLADYLDAISQLTDDKVMLGVDGRNHPVCWDMLNENPHMFTVGPSRIGKTRLLLLLVSQILSQGGSAVVIDPKRVGVKDVLGSHPHVDIYRDQRDVELMWKAIHQARLELDERIDQFDNGATDFKRRIIAIDEISLFSEMSRSAWEILRTPQESKIPPVWTDIKAIAYAGAQFKINLIVFGQAINERVLPNMVGQFGTRIMAGYSKRDFDRLVGVTPAIPSPRGRGRFLFHDGNQKLFQSLLGSDDELRELAFKAVAENDEFVIGSKPVASTKG